MYARGLGDTGSPERRRECTRCTRAGRDTGAARRGRGHTLHSPGLGGSVGRVPGDAPRTGCPQTDTAPRGETQKTQNHLEPEPRRQALGEGIPRLCGAQRRAASSADSLSVGEERAADWMRFCSFPGPQRETCGLPLIPCSERLSPLQEEAPRHVPCSWSPNPATHTERHRNDSLTRRGYTENDYGRVKEWGWVE